jgi:hypothetical protein
MSSRRLGLGAALGTVVFVVGAFSGSVVGALVGLVGLGAVVAALVALFGRVGALGRLGLGVAAGLLMVVVGLALGAMSYDERFFGDQSNRELWDAVSWAAAAVLGLGLLLAAVSLVGVVATAIARSVRGG